MSEAVVFEEEWDTAKENFQPLKRGREAKQFLHESTASHFESDEITKRQKCEHAETVYRFGVVLGLCITTACYVFTMS